MVYGLGNLGLDVNKVNPNVGAVALGQPTGATHGSKVSRSFLFCLVALLSRTGS
ncbi:hypothetical protein BKA56DRAFT_569465 [Ilyonectria sp. MPI-CAGE-AT-0026]|nr:hypothetical protein BKA56DRAFT_569465 [Ilyonectria sp. MPI-CAGE-AT-0026]